MNRWEQIQSISYRGKLDSCNYTCSYCPFAKKQNGQPDKQDEKLFEQFCDQMAKYPGKNLHIQILPYGEAMIHDYYRQGIIRLAGLPHIAGVGCQTNLSFKIDCFIREILETNTNPGKIKLWATFHPGMVTIKQFAHKIHQLKQSGVEICAGVVGNPEQLHIIQQLRNTLPIDTYLFINAMQGLKRKLTPVERKLFQEIDPLFVYEKGCKAIWETCNGGKTSLFVDATGNCYPCPRSPVKGGNLYRGDWKEFSSCGRKRCDCYIAYCQQSNHSMQNYMSGNNLWRIPERKQVEAAFFDIDGTLVNRQGVIPENYTRALRWLAGQIPLFLATALPLSYAKKRLGNLLPLFQGGVFADGGHIIYQGKDKYIPVETPPIINMQGVSCKHYTAGQITYKYAFTTFSPDITKKLKYELEKLNNYHIFTRGRLLTLTAKEANKQSGLLYLCNKINVAPAKIVAIGDTISDWGMLSVAGYPCAVPDAEPALLEKATYHITPAHIPLFFKSLKECPTSLVFK